MSLKPPEYEKMWECLHREKPPLLVELSEDTVERIADAVAKKLSEPQPLNENLTDIINSMFGIFPEDGGEE